MRLVKLSFVLQFILFIYLPNYVQANKLDIRFNKSAELLGFAYFLAYEGNGIETKTIQIGDQELLKKDWHQFGYQFYQQYNSFLGSDHLLNAMEVADHLWLDYILNLLLHIEEVPNASIPEGLSPKLYLNFSKTKAPQEALKNVKIFLNGLNGFYKEVKFGEFLEANQLYYDAALQEIKSQIPDNRFINHMEDYFQQTFQSYSLIPSLTIPKGMGFGIRNNNGNIFNVFGAVDFQDLAYKPSPKMGFENAKKIRELSIHEFGHSFINPVVANLPVAYFTKTASLFKPIKEAMNQQGYNTWKACLYEHFVRATELILSEKYDTKEAYEMLKSNYLEERQFIYIPHLRKILEEYRKKGLNYPQAVEKAMQELEKLASNPSNTEPCKVGWHTEDVSRFWEVYDELKPKHNGAEWQKRYIDQGSEGLAGFIHMRIENGKKLAKTVQKNKDYYENIRASSLDLEQFRGPTCEAYEQLVDLYPTAVFPNIYFVIGRRNTGGTVSKKGLIIGIERFGVPTDNFQPDIPISALNWVIAHELIHFQQNYAPSNTLLAQSIREGAADFLAEIITNKLPAKDNFIYGEANEAVLKAEFKDKMNDRNWSGWLYGGPNKSRPNDLGYWMGYKICKAYYNKAMDKQQAIDDILNVRDYEQFLAESGYFE